ncbi:MAG: hypothetical protein N4A71_22095 [Carboxylicivirga sp.]|jgi:hypothetical protein|nr:hypothetical protein [Carboxylicivirga sp.]
MSKYSEISKRIGWEGHCAIPSETEALKLFNSVVNQHCESAFELVFKIHRFAPTPDSQVEFRAMETINEAFRVGSQYFKQR